MCSVSGPLQTRCFMLSERSAPLSALCQGLISISTSLKKKHLGLPSSPRGFIPSLFDYEVKNLILLLLLLSSPQYILHPPPPTLSSPRMADSKRLFCFFIRLKASTIRFTVVVYGFGWLCVLAASCALWRRRQGFTHEWRIPKSRQQRDVDTN